MVKNFHRKVQRKRKSILSIEHLGTGFALPSLQTFQRGCHLSCAVLIYIYIYFVQCLRSDAIIYAHWMRATGCRAPASSYFVMTAN